jgi:Tol biopolymer transport system component
VRLFGPACVAAAALAFATTASAQVLRWSPDGEWIAIARVGTTRDGVSVMRSDGRGERFIRGSGAVRSDWIEWSPDSRHLAFGSFSPLGGSRTMLSSLELRTATLVTNDADEGFSWSPDSRFFVYGEYVRGGALQSALNVVSSDGSGGRRLVTPGRRPDWSPDGTEILFTSVSSDVGCGATLEAIRPDGGGRRVLSASASFLTRGRWSSAGDRIAYFSSCEGSGLRLVRRDGSGDRRLPDLVVGEEPWSPDGRWILGTSFGDPRGQRVVLHEVDGPRTITFPLLGGAPLGGSPMWSPLGTQVLFYRGPAVLGRLDGSERTLVRGDGFAWSPDGARVAFLRQVNDTVDARRCGRQAFVLALDGGGLRSVGVCAIRGSFDVDSIDGTSGVDEIQAFGGDDAVRAGSGDDRVNGGSGDDRLAGGPGRDVIVCGRGRDVVVGSHGDRVARDCEVRR